MDKLNPIVTDAGHGQSSIEQAAPASQLSLAMSAWNTSNRAQVEIVFSSFTEIVKAATF